jgi:hypothetical protein
MIVAISYEVGESNKRGNAIYTLVLSCLSVILAGGLWFVDTKNPEYAGMANPLFRFVVMTCFAIMWIVAACLVTFDGPFIVSGLFQKLLLCNKSKCKRFHSNAIVFLYPNRIPETDISLHGQRLFWPSLQLWLQSSR